MSPAPPAIPRIMLIHALADSVVPIRTAFAAHWPAAAIYDLMDTSLSMDHAADGGRLGEKMTERFRTLGRYAAQAGPDGRGSDAILFTCSAFGPAIEAVQRDQRIPVLKPNASAFDAALAAGTRIVLLVTFPPSLPPLTDELQAMARARGASVALEGRLVDGALAALQSGRPEQHDALIADAAASLPPVDAIVLGQFSMARAAPAVRRRVGAAILTTPEAAVLALRTLLDGAIPAAGRPASPARRG